MLSIKTSFIVTIVCVLINILFYGKVEENLEHAISTLHCSALDKKQQNTAGPDVTNTTPHERSTVAVENGAKPTSQLSKSVTLATVSTAMDGLSAGDTEISDFDALYIAVHRTTHFLEDTITNNEQLFPKYIELDVFYALFDKIIENDLSQHNVTQEQITSCFSENLVYGSKSVVAKIHDSKMTATYCQFMCRLINRQCRFFFLTTKTNEHNDVSKTCFLSGKKDTTTAELLFENNVTSESGPLICPDAVRDETAPQVPYADTLPLLNAKKRCPALNKDVSETDVPAFLVTSSDMYLTKHSCQELCLAQNFAVNSNKDYIPDSLGVGMLLAEKSNFTCKGWSYMRLPFGFNTAQGICRLYSKFTELHELGNDLAIIEDARSPTPATEVVEKVQETVDSYFDPIFQAVIFSQTPSCVV